MHVKIRGAQEHNLKNVDVDIRNGLTVVTGVSGSGKTSLIFDVLYKEARRRFLEVFSTNKDEINMNPAKVRSITGLGPTIALGQNLLNRNPNSILASASGLSPLIRLLYARFGERKCHKCGNELSVLKEDEIINHLEKILSKESVTISALLMRQMKGSHKTFLEFLSSHFDTKSIIIDGSPWNSKPLNPKKTHDIEIFIAQINESYNLNDLRDIFQTVVDLGASAIIIQQNNEKQIISRVPLCVECGTWFGKLEPTHFNRLCLQCRGKGCKLCNKTGLNPHVSNVYWSNLLFTEFLKKSVGELLLLFNKKEIIGSDRIISEIKKRLIALDLVGLDYLTLDRISPTLSRGESQRVRLAIALTSQLEDITYVLDEPTIGLHPADVARLLPVFYNLNGPVIYIEHDRQAAAVADNVIDIGPGAGNQGGEILFTGTPSELWKVNTPTGNYFSLTERVQTPKHHPEAKIFLQIIKASEHNLKNINVKIPLNRLTVITGVSGSGKSTLVNDILFKSLKTKEPVGCKELKGPTIKPIIIDQSPIGKNPRSNPATYTKISDITRNLYAKESKFTATHYSFNTSTGACPYCKGMGAIEIKMSYLPSTWIECSNCKGKRFSDEILSTKIPFGEKNYSIAEFYELTISKVFNLLKNEKRISSKNLQVIKKMLKALNDIGLGYLSLGQPSPTLSGGEAQRTKLSKFLGRNSLKNQLIILDEPSTGLHPQDLSGLLMILNQLKKSGATIVIVEHNIDLIKAADWIIDLGPDSGPNGGELIYEGPFADLLNVKLSKTAQALKLEASIQPQAKLNKDKRKISSNITIKNAHIHNLKNVSVEIPKKTFTVITGVSGSGKSSLLMDTLEVEARRRYLETLSMYERQGTRESSEALVEDVSGLGITALITPEKKMYGTYFNLRYTIGSITNINLHLANLMAYIAERACPKCKNPMEKKEQWHCYECDVIIPNAEPRHFISSNYASACQGCNGIGTIQVPQPGKLIIHPEKPLCKGAMYSSGFFPNGFLCKPYNSGYYIVQALAIRYEFDPFSTPWNKMTREAQNAFLYGDENLLPIHYENKKGQTYTRKFKFLGFYDQWLRDWDIGGTFSDIKPCKQCNGSGFRAKYLEFLLNDYNIFQLNEMSLNQLAEVISKPFSKIIKPDFVNNSHKIILARLNFLIKTGLSYINLNRVADTLSAGESQRIRLAGLLGSDLTSLTVLLDEPSRGLHPSELQSLLDVLLELRNKGNTIIIIEHDPLFMETADYMIDMGPQAGINGGKIVAKGSPEELKTENTITSQWLNGKKKFNLSKKPKKPNKWLIIYGARANNLKGEVIKIPHGLLVGLCGVSGSGKSTLLIDTLGMVLAPKKVTTSVSYDPIQPGKYDKIEGKLHQTIIIDQAKVKIGSPLKFLGLEKLIFKIYADSSDAKLLELNEKSFSNRCSVCRGKGFLKVDMKFLPDLTETCDTCKGSGYQAEAWKVHFKGVSLPEVNNLTIEEGYDLFKEFETISVKLNYAIKVGLGYLQLNQPARTLSGGECQRLKIVKELSKKSNKKTLYILDEPTIGQHLEDVSNLIDVLNILVEKGHTVAVIEHHSHVLASCDWLIEFGPGAGPEGGHIIANGPPNEIAELDTPTAPYLKKVLEGGI